MGDILQFIPTKKPSRVLGYRLSFYSDAEIELALIALNLYCPQVIRHNQSNIKEQDPLEIQDCLIRLLGSGLLSTQSNKDVKNILTTMTKIMENESYAN